MDSADETGTPACRVTAVAEEVRASDTPPSWFVTHRRRWSSDDSFQGTVCLTWGAQTAKCHPILPSSSVTNRLGSFPLRVNEALHLSSERLTARFARIVDSLASELGR